MAQRKKLKEAKDKNQLQSPVGSGAVKVSGYWSLLLSNKFKGCKQLAEVPSPHYVGNYKLFWIEDVSSVGVIGPDKAAWICPVSPIHFTLVNVPKLVAKASQGIFPVIRKRAFIIEESTKILRKRSKVRSKRKRLS